MRSRRNLRRFVVGFLLALGAGPYAARAETTSAEPFVWRMAAPASHGLSGAKLDELKDGLAARRTKALLVIRNDRIVYEWYATDHGPEKRHYSASLAKALVGGTSLMLALQDKRLDADDPAWEFVPQWRDDPERSKITIRHLATHSSGIEDAETPGKGHFDQGGWKEAFWRKSPDPFSISRDEAPILFDPGTHYAYSNPGMAMLAYAVTASYRDSAYADIRDLLKRRIMDPIGVPDNEWSIGYGQTYDVDGLRLVANWGGGSFTARAVARLGRLMLHNGTWLGRRLVDSKWVASVTSYAGTPLPARPPGNPQPSSGLGWWTNSDGVWSNVPRDAFAGAGAGNQILLVVPSLDLIVVRNGGEVGDRTKGEGFWGGLETYLFNPLMAAITEEPQSSDESLHAAIPGDVWPEQEWERASPQAMGMDDSLLEQARDYALTGGGSGYITRHGRLVMAWGDPSARYDLKSTSKSIGITSLGLALADGKLQLADEAGMHHPHLGVPPESNRETGWLDEITILHLATQTGGFEKPGGYEELIYRPGTRWHYSDGGPNWLAECVTRIYQRDVEDLLFDRVFRPIGITREDLRWRNHAYRPHRIDGIMRREFGSGVHANVDAMARIGHLYLRRGRWNDHQLIPASFVDMARTPVASVMGLPEEPFDTVDSRTGRPRDYGNASAHYGLLWWNNADGSLDGVPRDTYWSWGLYDSLIVVIPSLDVVIARAGKSWQRGGTWTAHYDVLAPFFAPIVASVHGRAQVERHRSGPRPPYPQDRMFAAVEWAPRSAIIRQASGSDNWPITWADDGHLYTAYGDGWGFEPRTEKKLSLGLAKIVGDPPNIRGENIRSATAERIGQGADGEKASGMLMVDGVLYMWVRNAGNAQLAWSTDHGASWTWSDWKFTTSFGAPTFLNFGRNYAGARDRYVYVYSHDADSAYEPADRMVLARVAKDRIRQQDAYEFFRKRDASGSPLWTNDIDERGAVFEHAGRCYRSGVSYNASLERYFWCQIHPESTDSRGPRFQGGFGIYAAPQPWGPWTTVYFTNEWDVGPGETASFPPKWMSADGETMHMVFSGDDYFSVRKATLKRVK